MFTYACACVLVNSNTINKCILKLTVDFFFQAGVAKCTFNDYPAPPLSPLYDVIFIVCRRLVWFHKNKLMKYFQSAAGVAFSL